MYIYAVLGGNNIVESFVTSDVAAGEDELEVLILVDAVDETWIRRKKYDTATQTFVDASFSDYTYQNSLEFTHIDADGTKHWLDGYINDLAEDVANIPEVDTSGFATADHTHTEYASSSHTHTPASIGAAASSHTHDDYAASSHNHSASNITSGTLAINRGGTGSTVAKTNITINRGADAGTGSSAFGYTCQYIPYLNMCFVRVYVQPKSTWSADTEYEVGTVGSSTYYPVSMMALSNYAQKEVSAYVNTEGKIVVRPYESVGTSYGIRLAGFWFCG